jgi:hypothetical protein
VTHPSLGARSAAAGARIGLRAAVFFSVLALAGWLVAGESAFERRLGIGPGALILVYLFGGVPGGVVFALLRPRVRDAWSAALAGAATLLPVAAARAPRSSDVRRGAPAAPSPPLLPVSRSAARGAPCSGARDDATPRGPATRRSIPHRLPANVRCCCQAGHGSGRFAPASYPFRLQQNFVR